jgi:hypothetical protein
MVGRVQRGRLRKVSELQAALDSRVIIEQAIGIWLSGSISRPLTPSKFSVRQRVTRDGK